MLLTNCSASQPHDLVLVTLDTTRADALGAYGRTPSPSPTVDELAREGARVDEVMTVTPLTVPAHAALLTGVYPDRTHVRDNMSFRLADTWTTLAESLRSHGYSTGAFVSAAVLSPAFGLDQGFDRYSCVTVSPTNALGIPRRSASAVVDDALGWLKSVPPEVPVFTWVHIYDAHRPYDPSADALRLFPDDPYLASINGADREVGRLLDGFQAAGRNPVVVVVGDHGEGRGDHGEETHGWFAYRSTMRVPLVIAGPGVAPGIVIDGPQSVVDVMPTVLDLLGLAGVEGVDGVSFADALRSGRPLAREPVYGESFTSRLEFGFSELRVIENAKGRYILAPSPEYYRWRVDPGELVNDAAQLDAVGEALRKALLARTSADAAGSTPSQVDPNLMPALAALGYTASAGQQEPGEPLPDPKDSPGLPEVYDAMMIRARSVPPAEGIPEIEGFLDEYPRVVPARMLLARAYFLTGRFSDGLTALQPILTGNAQAQELEIRLLMANGRNTEAVAVARVASDTWPHWAGPYAAMAAAKRVRKDCAGALQEVAKGVSIDPDDGELLLVRGACGGPGAEADLRRVLVLDPGDQEVRLLLGTRLAKSGRVQEAIPLLKEQATLTPLAPIALSTLGVALYDSGAIRDAIAPLSKCVDEDVGAEPPLVLADALLQTGGDLSDAMRLLDLAERRDPSENQVLAVRARVLKAMGRIADAQAVAKTYQQRTSGARAGGERVSK